MGVLGGKVGWASGQALRLHDMLGMFRYAETSGTLHACQLLNNKRKH